MNSSVGKISNMAQLHLEIRRLQALKSHQEDLIKEDLQQVKKSFHPKKLLASLFGSVTTGNENNPDLLRNGLSFGINLLSDSMLFGKAPSIVKYLLTQLIQKTAADAVSGKPDGIVDKVKSVLSFILAKKKKPEEGEPGESTGYDENEPYGM